MCSDILVALCGSDLYENDQLYSTASICTKSDFQVSLNRHLQTPNNAQVGAGIKQRFKSRNPGEFGQSLMKAKRGHKAQDPQGGAKSQVALKLGLIFPCLNLLYI